MCARVHSIGVHKCVCVCAMGEATDINMVKVAGSYILDIGI